jgi:hypothetical protein
MKQLEQSAEDIYKIMVDNLDIDSIKQIKYYYKYLDDYYEATT